MTLLLQLCFVHEHSSLKLCFNQQNEKLYLIRNEQPGLARRDLLWLPHLIAGPTKMIIMSWSLYLVTYVIFHRNLPRKTVKMTGSLSVVTI